MAACTGNMDVGVWGILPTLGNLPSGIMHGSMPGSMPGPGVAGKTAGVNGSRASGWVPGGGAPALGPVLGTDAMIPSAYEKV